MKPPRRIFWPAISLAPVLLASCVTSVHPLSDDETSNVEKRMIGIWLSEPEQDGGKDRDTVVLAKKAGSRNSLEMTLFDFDKDWTMTPEKGTIYVRPGKEGTNSGYLSIVPPHDEDEKSHGVVMLAKYEFTDDATVKIFSLDPNPIRKGVTDGVLKGTIKKRKPLKLFGSLTLGDDNNHTDVVLDDSPDAIAAFLDEHSDECFKELVIYKRIKGAPSPLEAEALAPDGDKLPK